MLIFSLFHSCLNIPPSMFGLWLTLQSDTQTHTCYFTHNCPIFLSLVENATRLCTPQGWAEVGNYAGCEDASSDSTLSPENEMVELSTIIYYIGYTISLLALLLAVVVFINFKWVLFLFNFLHANVFCCKCSKEFSVVQKCEAS